MFVSDVYKQLNINAQLCKSYIKYLKLNVEYKVHPKSHNKAWFISAEDFNVLKNWIDSHSWEERRMMIRKTTDKEEHNSDYYINIEKSKETKAERYGNENYNNGKQISETLKGFSTDKKKQIVDKRNKTKLEKYNDGNYNNIEKAKETNLRKYGVEYPCQNKDILDKTQETNIKRYGCKWACSNKELKEKRYKKWNRYNPSVAKYKFNGILFDSKVELCFYIYHKEVLKDDITRGKVFEYFCNGSLHKYECDFYVNGENVEIKGNHFLNKDMELIDFYGDKHVLKEKTECLKKNKVKIIKSLDLKDIVKKITKEFNIEKYKINT